MIIACGCGGSPDVINVLLTLGADVNLVDKHGNSALIVACAKKCSLDIIKMLLKFGAYINLVNKHGNSALIMACANGCSENVINMLLQFRANVNLVNKDGASALMFAISNMLSVDVIQQLIKSGANVNQQDSDGRTAFMLAANKQSAEVIKILIDAGADIDLKYKEMRNAAYYCLINSNYEYIKYFIQKYFNVLLNKYDQTCYIDDYGHRSTKQWFVELEYFLNNVVFFENWIKETKVTQREIIEKTNEIFLNLLKVSKIKVRKETKEIKTGIDFEKYVRNILEQTGFKVKITPSTGDQGVDLIAEFNSVKYAIQCKYYSRPVGNKAVQEVIAGMGFYKCDVACVVSNNTYTEAARK